MPHSTPAQVLSAYQQAVHDRDHDTFVALYAPDAVIVDAFDADRITTRERWSALVHDWFDHIKAGGSADLADVRIEESGDLAYALATATYRGESFGGDSDEVTNRYTAVLRRGADGWLIVHEHTSVPGDMEPGTGVH